MGTRSSITVKHSDGKYHGVYCHWDGYESHHWPILTQHYNTQELAEALVSHGDMSSLDVSCEGAEGHTFDTEVKGQTTYYGRDRGEDGVETTIRNTLEEVHERVSQGYDYVFEDGEWYLHGASEEQMAELRDGKYDD